MASLRGLLAETAQWAEATQARRACYFRPGNTTDRFIRDCVEDMRKSAAKLLQLADRIEQELTDEV